MLDNANWYRWHDGLDRFISWLESQREDTYEWGEHPAHGQPFSSKIKGIVATAISAAISDGGLLRRVRRFG